MNIIKFRETVDLGKIDYNQSGRKNCPVEFEVKIVTETVQHEKETDNHYILPIGAEYDTLSICGTVWNPLKTDCYMGGQCLEEIIGFKLSALSPLKKSNVMRLVDIWRNYHLNDMTSGCIHQSYENQEPCMDSGYRYGHKWLIKPLPRALVLEVIELCNIINPKSEG